MSTLVLNNISKEMELRILKLLQGEESQGCSHSGWAVVRRADKGKEMGISLLALVDRKKEKKLWWISDDSSLIMKFNSKSAADFQCNKYRYGNPIVIPYDRACEIIREQAGDIEEFEIEEMAYGGPFGEHSMEG